jgi:hypothetical protein
MAIYNTFKKISTRAIIDGEITSTKFAPESVTTDKLGPNGVETVKIQDGAVTTGKLNQNVNLAAKTMVYRPFTDNDFSSAAITGTQLASAAITTNLGYNPVNRVGDTMTGTLQIQNGNRLSSSAATDSGIRIEGDTISIQAAGTNRLTFDSTGRPVESARPAFLASGNGGWRYANSYGGPGSWRELDDMAWNYTTTGGITTSNNCRVTAPVSGFYYFYLSTYWYNDANNTNGYTHWNIGVNSAVGTSVTGRTPHSMYSHGQNNNHCPGIMVTLVTYLNAGQYASPQPYWGGNQGRHHGDHSFWAGYLIG